MKLYDGGLIIVLVFIGIVFAAAVAKAVIEDDDCMDNVKDTARCFFHVHNN